MCVRTAASLLLLLVVCAASSGQMTTLNDMENATRTHPEVTTLSTEDDDQSLSGLEPALQLYIKYIKVLTPVGYVGNFLSFITFVGMSRRQNIALVLMCMSITDSIGIMNLIDLLIYSKPGSTLGEMPVGCRILPFLYFGARGASNWLCCLVALERFLSVRFPLKVALWCTRRRIKAGILVSIFLGLGLECWRPYTLRYSKVYMCGSPEHMIQLVARLGFIVSKVIGYMVPWFLIACLNAGLVVTLRRWLLQRQESLGASAGGGEGKGPDRSLTLMFICMSLFSLTCCLPSLYAEARLFYHNNQGGQFFDYIRVVGGWRFIYVQQAMLMTNHAFNFFIYCLTGSSFRRQLLAVLRRALVVVSRGRLGAVKAKAPQETKLSNISSSVSKDNQSKTDT